MHIYNQWQNSRITLPSSPLRLTIIVFGLLLSLNVVGCLPNPSMQNITIEVPEGTSDHGNPHLLCTPTKWTDIATFFVGNYFAHVLTIKVYPGEGLNELAVVFIVALLFPTSGVVRGIVSILRHSAFMRSELEKAAHSGALCMVVRSQDWEPETDDVFQDAVLIELPNKDLSKLHFNFCELLESVY